MDEETLKVIDNWRDFNKLLSDVPEEKLKELLVYELENENRKSIVERLHQRYNTLRTMRERAELMKGFK